MANNPLDEEQVTLSDDEQENLQSMKEAVTDGLKKDKSPLIQEVTQILCLCYSKEECERYFKPTFVAIGPLNYEKETGRNLRFERGEKWKLQLAGWFIFCCGNAEEFYKNVKKEINSLKKCYNSQAVEKWNDKKLAWMFLVDGCALLHFIALDVNDAWEAFSVDNDIVSIEKVDFFLLENQLPYRLLEILINSIDEEAFQSWIKGESLAELADTKPKKLFKKFINDFIHRIFLSLIAEEQPQNQVDQSQPHSPNEPQHEMQVDQPQENPAHLLDMLRRRLMGVKSKEKKQITKDNWWRALVNRDKSKHWVSINNAKELKDKGIRFKVREKADAITGIDFNDHYYMPTLTLSPIFLHNTTVPLLLNLMAYELCPDFKENCEIVSHLSFLDYLIDNGEDVKELRDAKVLHHGLGSDAAVANLFNKISGILVPNLVIDSELKRNIHEYCNSNRSYLSGLRASAEAHLTHICFRRPWTIFVLFAALAGLIMTGIQTHYSVPGNKSPNEL